MTSIPELADLEATRAAVSDPARANGAPATAAPDAGATKAAEPLRPEPPRTLAETGLRAELVTELIVKTVYFAGECTGQHVVDTIKLAWSVLDPLFTYLRKEKFIEVKGLDGRGPTSYRYQMTDIGRVRAQEFLERSQYVGPAPVTLAQYTEWVERQSVQDLDQEPQFLRQALGQLIISEELLHQLGPAVLSGRSMFLYGPAGNGKTTIAEAIASGLGGSMYVPHALEVDGSIIKVFDRASHRPIELDRPASLLRQQETPYDPRWVLTRRPVMFVGGELTLPMLDLQFNTIAKYYEAPFQVKANGGVFLIDDLGRQLVKPQDLLNRWIVPLEDRIDYLTLHTGKKFPVPFDSLVIFATNLNPWDLVDEAFLRRIRYKIPIENPTREQYERLFRLICESKGITYEPEAVEFVYEEYYGRRGLYPRFCHPRDIVDHLYDAFRYARKTGGASLRDAVARACDSYFLQNPFEHDPMGIDRNAAPGAAKVEGRTAMR